MVRASCSSVGAATQQPIVDQVPKTRRRQAAACQGAPGRHEGYIPLQTNQHKRSKARESIKSLLKVSNTSVKLLFIRQPSRQPTISSSNYLRSKYESDYRPLSADHFLYPHRTCRRVISVYQLLIQTRVEGPGNRRILQSSQSWGPTILLEKLPVSV